MKLSIITINRNNAAGLARTLESTFGAQPGFDDWEQIVVDGASSDGSFAVLDKWKDDPHLGWHVSEPDTGIYNAMNKAAVHARGDYLLFLNSGDVLLHDSLAKVFSEEWKTDLAYGDIVVERNGQPILTRIVETPEEIVPAYFLFQTLPHQATLISRRLLLRQGGYDESLRIVADVKFFFNCILDRPSVSLRKIPFAFSAFDTDGISSSPERQMELRTEWESIVAPVFGRFAAHRAQFPPINQPWIRRDVAEHAMQDAELSNALRRSSTAVSALWSIPPLRFALRLVGRAASFFRQIFLRLGQSFRHPASAHGRPLPPKSTP